MPSASYDRATAAAAVASAVLSAVAVVVTWRVAYVQDRANDRQAAYSRALAYADIYFSDQVSRARDSLNTAYVNAYERIRKSKDPNTAVADLITTTSQQIEFDKLLAMYEQIAACANNNVCNSDVTSQLYGQDIHALFENWYGYIIARRTQLRSADYGCQIARFVNRHYPNPDCKALGSIPGT